MSKSEEAFRTISEVSTLMKLEPHVLRFWETKFKQIQPIKRARGRRLYRPEDVAMIANIKRLLYERGMTIKGVQKVLREQGVAAFRSGEVGIPVSTPVDSASSELAGSDAVFLSKLRAQLVKAKAVLSGVPSR